MRVEDVEEVLERLGRWVRVSDGISKIVCVSIVFRRFMMGTRKRLVRYKTRRGLMELENERQGDKESKLRFEAYNVWRVWSCNKALRDNGHNEDLSPN